MPIIMCPIFNMYDVLRTRFSGREGMGISLVPHFSLAPTEITMVSGASDHLSFLVRDMGTHGGHGLHPAYSSIKGVSKTKYAKF